MTAPVNYSKPTHVEDTPEWILKSIRAQGGPDWLFKHISHPWVDLCREMQRHSWPEFKNAIAWASKRFNEEKVEPLHTVMFFTVAVAAYHARPIVEYIVEPELMDAVMESDPPTELDLTVEELFPLPYDAFAVRDARFGPRIFYTFAKQEDTLIIIANDGQVSTNKLSKKLRDCVKDDAAMKWAIRLSNILMYITGSDDVEGASVPPRTSGKKYRNKNFLSPVIRGTVGGKFVSALRKYKAQQEAAEGVRPHGSPRPHMRAGHFHRYWTGPGRTILRSRFIHPCLVNADSVGPDTEIQRTVKA